MDVRAHNREAWNAWAKNGCCWSVPVSPEIVAAARAGNWEIYLTPTRPIPTSWLGDVTGRSVLCLASGGGQQGPVLAAAGANVTVFDNSPVQLEMDQLVAKRENLLLQTMEGDMRDLSALADCSFDLIVHPVSNPFVPDVRPVWLECSRVLRPGGCLLAGFDTPLVHMLDDAMLERGELRIAHACPYSDIESLSPEDLRQRAMAGRPLEFGHTLTDLIGGQIDAGFDMIGFYEDRNRPEENDLLDRYTATYIATRARKR